MLLPRPALDLYLIIKIRLTRFYSFLDTRLLERSGHRCRTNASCQEAHWDERLFAWSAKGTRFDPEIGSPLTTRLASLRDRIRTPIEFSRKNWRFAKWRRKIRRTFNRFAWFDRRRPGPPRCRVAHAARGAEGSTPEAGRPSVLLPLTVLYGNMPPSIFVYFVPVGRLGNQPEQRCPVPRSS